MSILLGSVGTHVRFWHSCEQFWEQYYSIIIETGENVAGQPNMPLNIESKNLHGL